MKENNKTTFLLSYIWKFLERFGSKGITFIVGIVLARLLAPDDFGVIAIVMVFINLCNVFVQGGLNTSLIQKKNADKKDFDVVFCYSFIISAILYLVLFFAAPFISVFYEIKALNPVLRVYGLTLFLCSINSIQTALLTRRMNFRSIFISNLIAVIVSGAAGILAAYLSFGIWALVVQQVSFYLVSIIAMQFSVRSLFAFSFSWEKGKSLFSFGWKILLTNLLSVLFVNVRTLLIGKKYNSSDVAYYSKGKSFPDTAMDVVNGSLQSVLLPTFSRKQNDFNSINVSIRRGIGLVSFLMFPVMLGIALLSKPIVLVLLTDKWEQAIFYMQAYCIGYMMVPIQTTYIQAITATGRSDSVLKLYFIFFLIQIVSILATINYGIVYVVIADLVINLLFVPICMFASKRITKCPIKPIVIDLIKNIIPTIFMGVMVYGITQCISSNILTIIASVISGVICYFGISILLGNKYFVDLINVISKTFKK